MRYLITGGMGFIGSNFIRHLLDTSSDIDIINLDKLTYAGNLDNLRDFKGDSRHTFIKGDICDKSTVDPLLEKVDIVVNFAAETHVDRSILYADDFLKTDIYGTFALLEAARKHGIKLFIQISTDEVYGQVPKGMSSKETDPLIPRNPYSASKAGADRLAFSYFATHNLPVIITRASNNYGAFQYPEKLIPLFVTNLLEGKKVPVYGDGRQIRDWLHVRDHCKALSLLIEKGRTGQVYNIGGGNEMMNIEITQIILNYLNKDEEMIEYVPDRPGHDLRYSLNCSKMLNLGWEPQTKFLEGINKTIQWYIDNEWWWKRIKSGQHYKQWIETQYEKRFS
jgi:dTDP-glucose 4,6-dehydratase